MWLLFVWLHPTIMYPLLGGKSSGYGVMHKVRIERFDLILNTIELVGNTSKIHDKWKTRKQ
jgi:hypothetical protein